ncbi:hypothetical protein D5R93_08925 [Actinomyces lilanjuaniae]|uniref:Uncharacterized protein n=1 Tax=Actinomyces lilanjuaniae TaxID=2321394 RepID=A0ABM6Z409_9ACTO|nr:hypothetical protein D5R93_08925 [Actinomyces lilanjuaniae]
MLTPCREGTEVTVLLLDASGRTLMGHQERRSLGALGWRVDSAAASRLLPDSAAAAEMTARILIEILHVAHPADLSCHLEVLSAP